MGSKVVYRSLTELFPQIDARILKAVAIEHPKDVNDAAAVVISEFVPLFYPNMADDSTTQSGDKTPVDVPDNKVEERDMQNSGSETVASSSGTRAPTTELLSEINQLTNVMPNGGDVHIQSKSTIGLSGSTESGVVSSELPDLVEPETKLTSDASQGVGFHVTANQDESGRRTVSEDAETSDAESSGSTSKDSLAVENGEPELGDAFSSVVSRSTQGCNIDHLEQIIEDAKSNKRTLFTVMDSIMNLMREVEHQEKDAEKLKENATRGGFDTLNKVEDLKKILAHAKERNDMDAGEVYGERSILSTEVTELENRLLNLSEDRDKSLSVLHEMRGVLETRLEAALEIKNAAEKEKQEKEGCARKALAEQEAIMEKVVQESKLLQQEAEENSKLREFLMDRGRIVDSLQGEISVICQDIRHLKEKFDNRVPLSQSISSSQTSCKLASSISSMKSLLLEKPSEPSYETPEASGSDESPKALVNEEKDERKELMEDGWDIFDKETEL
uniref:CUE domain-containing protein n=1 Tax=Noccaea caerulescens TaxID=107243 RepID=A0A1J3HP15_NOCCA